MINATAVKTMRFSILSVILHICTILGLKIPYSHLSRPSRVSAIFWFWDFKVPSVNKGLKECVMTKKDFLCNLNDHVFVVNIRISSISPPSCSDYVKSVIAR